MEKEVKKAYQHFAYLVRDVNDELEVRFAKFDDENKTSLVGAHVWDELERAGRAVRPGGLTVDGLLLSLQNELPRTLAEVKDTFWSNPRMPLLSSVEELRQALFDALRNHRLELTDEVGEVRPIPDRVSNLPIGSWTIKVRLPETNVSDDGAGSGDASQATLWSRDSLSGQASTQGSASVEYGPEATSKRVPRDPQSIVRTQLTLKARIGMSNQTKRDTLVGLLKRLISLVNTAADEEVESITLSLEVIGDKELLQETANVAKQIEGTQPRFDDLPS